MSPQRYLISASLLLILGFVAFNWLIQSGLASWRSDLTERQLYTVSEGTRHTIRQLSEPIDLTLVYTRRVGQDYPAVRAHAARLREVLNTYKAQWPQGLLRWKPMAKTRFILD